jgi:2-keto-4-pentenoate hydratase
VPNSPAPTPRSGERSSLDIAAECLRNAYRLGPIESLRETLAASDIDSAYAIQSINTDFWRQAGRRVVGQKIGLTSAAVQRQLGVDQPDFGVLFDDMLVTDGGVLTSDQVLQARVEGEVAFVMGRDFDNPRATVVDLMSAIAYALPAIEVVDSRLKDWKITIADTVADNASAAFFVLGSQPQRLAGLDLLTCGMVLTLDGNVASVGAGGACMGHPLAAAAWLASTLSSRGQTLRAGDIIMSGALGPMAAVAPGNQVRVKIGGLGTAEFSFRSAQRDN